MLSSPNRCALQLHTTLCLLVLSVHENRDINIKKKEMRTNKEAEAEVEVKGVFIGAGCNRVVNNVSWGASDLVSFGAQNAVAIFCPKVSLSFSFPFMFFNLKLL